MGVGIFPIIMPPKERALLLHMPPKLCGEVPSDTKLLLTKNYFEIVIFKITNFTRNSTEKSFFPGDFKAADSLENYEK